MLKKLYNCSIVPIISPFQVRPYVITSSNVIFATFVRVKAHAVPTPMEYVIFGKGHSTSGGSCTRRMTHEEIQCRPLYGHGQGLFHSFFSLLIKV